MPASTGSHCSRCVSQRGLMVERIGAVLVALASCRAALSPRDSWVGVVSAMDLPVGEFEYGYEEMGGASVLSPGGPINRL